MRPILLGFITVVPLLAQTTVSSIGYTAPEPVYVAPGQIVTLYVRASQMLTSTLTAPGLPLPRTLGPFQVSLSQTASPNPVAVPILSAGPVTNCASPLPAVCPPLTAITVQIPFELFPNVPAARAPQNFASLTVTENGTAGQPIALSPLVDRIHIENSCDTARNPGTPPCQPDIRHADGTLVTAAQPAAPGETLTLLAYGLGSGDANVISGSASPVAAHVPDVVLAFRYGTQAVGSNPATVDFVAGEAGVYRTTFQAPAIPAGTPSCSATSNNLTVTLSRIASSDSASICVNGPTVTQTGRVPTSR